MSRMEVGHGRLIWEDHLRAAGSVRLAGLLLVVFVLSSVGVVSAREPNRPIGDGEPSPALSETDPNWRAGVRRRDARARRLAGPVEKRRREASRTAFDDVSRTGALALAKRELPELFATPLFDGAEPEPGMRVVQQGGEGTAVVEDVKTGKRVVLQSNVPLQTDDGGTMAPVDLSLETVGANLESDNAFVPLSVDRTSSADVTFPESGFSVEVAGKAKDRLVQRSAGRLFFAETRPDTDALVTPTVMGAELGLVLRTEAAPERQVLDFDLPAGATLRHARVRDPIPGDPPGALEIRRDKKTIGYLSEPNVFDADGQSVRSRMAFRGDKVTIDVDHHGRDIRYPVFVDPEISVYGQFYSNWDGWNWSQALKEPRNYSLAEGYGATKNNCAYACGLYESHPTHTWNANGSYANWYYRAGPNTFIYRAVFGGTYHDGMLISGRNHTDAFQGLMNSAYNAWESMSFTNGQGYVGPNPYGPAEPSFANSTLNFCVNLNACSQAGNLSEENYALFGIVTQNKFGCCAVNSDIYKGSTAMATANVYLGDRRNPTLTGGLPSDSPWRDDNNAVNTLSPRGRDDGLGLYSFTLSGAASGNGTQRIRSINDPNQDCSGSPHYLQCPANGPEGTTTFGYRLNEGTTRLSVNAQDAVDNPTSTHSWLERVDRSPPASVELTGPVWDARTRPSSDGGETGGLFDGAADMSVTAVDNGSGVGSIELLVDGRRMDPTHLVTGTCSGSTCDHSVSARFSVGQLEEGNHGITVVARDGLSDPSAITAGRHSATRAFTVYSGGPNGEKTDPTATTEDAPEAGTSDMSESPTCDASDESTDPLGCSHDPGSTLVAAAKAEQSVESDVESLLLVGDQLVDPPPSSPAVVRSASTTGCQLGSPVTRKVSVAAGKRWGLSDESSVPDLRPAPTDPGKRSTFDNADAVALRLQRVRLVVPVDVVWRAARETDPTAQDCNDYQIVRRFIEDAVLNEQPEREVLISFERRRRPNAATFRPSVQMYKEYTQEFLRQFPAVRLYTSWNEPNRVRYQPTAGTSAVMKESGAYVAGQYWRALNEICQRGNKCLAVAGDFLDDSSFGPKYLAQYLKGMGRGAGAQVSAYHPYGAIRYGPNSSSANRRWERFRKSPLGSDTKEIWMTEGGANLKWFSGTASARLSAQGGALGDFLNSSTSLFRSTTKIKRFYYYEWYGAQDNDAGLVGESDQPGTLDSPRRPVYCTYRRRTNPGPCSP
jgi:hypothetical protein